MELAVTPTLGALVAEHRPHVPHALAAVVQQVVLNGGAHQAGCALGAQRELLAVQAILERVHLFFHNVGHLADAAHKQLGVLNDGRAHIAVGEAVHHLAHLRFQPLPAGGLAGQDVVHAFDGVEFLVLSHK